MSITPTELDILRLTLKVALASTLAMALPGLFFGWLLARRRLPGRLVIESLLLLPMVLPPVAVGLALLELASPSGPLGRLWESATGEPLVLTWQAAALAAFAVSLPLYIKGAQQAFLSVPLRLEQVACTLGASRVRVFVTVTLPLAARGLAAGLLLAFARSLGEFGATSLVAGSIPGSTETLALGIYGRIVNGHDGAAWRLAGLSAALALGALAVSHALLARGAFRRGDPRL